MERLRALPPERIAGDLTLTKVLDAALDCVKLHFILPNRECNPQYSGTPMIDNYIMPLQPQAAFESGAAANIPVIIGTTASDLPELVPSPRDPFGFFGADAAAAWVAYNVPGGNVKLTELLPLLVNIGADRTMHEPARFVSKQVTAHGKPAWLYRFTYTAESTRPKSLEQAHAGELPFLFDMIAAKYGGAVTAKDRATAEAFNHYVGNFIKTGNPNGAGLPQWSQFDPNRFDVMNFTPDDGPVMMRDPRAAGVELVEKVMSAEAQ